MYVLKLPLYIKLLYLLDEGHMTYASQQEIQYGVKSLRHKLRPRVGIYVPTVPVHLYQSDLHVYEICISHLRIYGIIMTNNTTAAKAARYVSVK